MHRELQLTPTRLQRRGAIDEEEEKEVQNVYRPEPIQTYFTPKKTHNVY